MIRRLAAPLLLLLVLLGCAPAEDAELPSPRTPGETTQATTTTTTRAAEPHPVSLPALRERGYDGDRLRLGRVVLRTGTHVERDVTWRAGDLRLTGRIAIPHGDGPFPAIVLAHGYIEPSSYVTGQGMTRERAWFGSHDYVALHVDYRNHAGSSRDPQADVRLRIDYTEDVVSAVHALRDWDGPVDDERMAVGGRSMGGGVVYDVLTVEPGLVDAAVVWAPVSSLVADNFDRWIRRDPERSGVASLVLDRYGDPHSDDPDVRRFWRDVSPRTFAADITEPLLVHHGTLDDSCPIRWSRQTVRAFRAAGVDVTYREYDGEGHAFGPQFMLSMERTTAFLARHLDG